MNVEFLPAADEELNEAAAYYEERVPGLGEDLLAEAEAGRDLLSLQPNLGVKLDAIHRRLPLRRFPFGLIFRVDPGAVRVVAFAHNRRRPGYWRSRTR
jgi:toxin ParE1/3/4